MTNSRVCHDSFIYIGMATGSQNHDRPTRKMHIATHCKTLQHSATHCNTLQHSATLCNTLQHTATGQLETCTCMCLDSFIGATTHSYVCQDSFTCVMTHSHVCHDSFAYIKMATGTQSNQTIDELGACGLLRLLVSPGASVCHVCVCV